MSAFRIAKTSRLHKSTIERLFMRFREAIYDKAEGELRELLYYLESWSLMKPCLVGIGLERGAGAQRARS